MTGAIVLFFIVIIAFMLITEIFTVLFRLTGLPEAKARLQVVSLLTTCGFTTKETEIFVTTPARRKLAITAMIFGYAFSATLVSAFVSIVLSLGSQYDSSIWITFGILLAVLFVVILLSKIKFVKNAFDSLIFKLAHKLSKSKTKNFLKVIDDYGLNSIVELTLIDIPNEFKDKKWMKNRTDCKDKPLNIYEVHLGSWKTNKKDENAKNVFRRLSANARNSIL